ncbi:oocyte zinc finger protein XlCOF20-like [Polypterus senegalus]|uniref:oocyte zinc finger protein XlCOF20-like n=1 Tax=Polypterus senegalus TaxID=55291 RepID=UPI001963532D|nr:oocyte zinc finger protein XlCOF20-like [Polypterus senegalus]
MDIRLAHIKQEDCEWGAPEDLCVKVEDCDSEGEAKRKHFVVKVEDSKDFSVSLELQKCETENAWKQDVSEESPPGLQSWLTDMGQLANQENSTGVKSELLEFKEEMREGEEQQPPSSSVGMSFQDHASFSTSSFAQTSHQCRLQQKQVKEKMKESTRGSNNVTSVSFQRNSPSAGQPTQSGAVITDQFRTGRKHHHCLECGKQFSHNSSLYKHMKIHAGEKPHCCSECGKRFLERNYLNVHMTVHTGEKPHCCPECGKRFSQIRSLQIHTRIHTGEKPYSCPECGKRFYDSSSLQKHTRIHTGEKPYCCFECGKRLSNSSNFRSHVRIHTGEKPYTCSQCGKRFSSSGGFRKHRQIHTGEKPPQNVANDVPTIAEKVKKNLLCEVKGSHLK